MLKGLYRSFGTMPARSSASNSIDTLINIDALAGMVPKSPWPFGSLFLIFYQGKMFAGRPCGPNFEVLKFFRSFRNDALVGIVQNDVHKRIVPKCPEGHR